MASRRDFLATSGTALAASWLAARPQDVQAALDHAIRAPRWRRPVQETTFAAHLLGTRRMSDDPRKSVVDEHRRAHDVPNVLVSDGSSLVTGGRGQPTATIQALAYRAGEHIARFARRGEI